MLIRLRTRSHCWSGSSLVFELDAEIPVRVDCFEMLALERDGGCFLLALYRDVEDFALFRVETYFVQAHGVVQAAPLVGCCEPT